MCGEHKYMLFFFFLNQKILNPAGEPLLQIGL